MVKILPLEKAKEKWSSRASIAGTDYAEGVKAADWQSAAASDQAEKNWSTAIQEAISKKRRAEGVKKVSNEAWRSIAAEKGQTRYTGEVGTDRAKSKWETGFKPYHGTIAGWTPSIPRGPRGTDTNWERSKELGMKLRDQRKGAAK
jgi:hypothetical protein